MEPKRLFRSRTNKIIAGVCGGLAEYFDVDPVIMRILFVLLTLFGGSGLLLYIACLIIMPLQPITGAAAESASSTSNLRAVFGIILVGLGVVVLLSNLGLFSFFHIWHISWSFVFPVLLILLGMAIIYYKQTEAQPKEVPPADGGEPAATPSAAAPRRQFRRSFLDRKIFGVCGGLAQYFSIDSTLVRILYIVLCLASFGAGVVLYITLALIVPDDRLTAAGQPSAR